MRDRPRDPTRLARGVVAGLAIATAASWVRFGLERTLVLDTSTATFIFTSLLLGLGLGIAGVAALGLAWTPGLTRRERLGYAFLAHLAAFFALPMTSRDLFSNLAYGGLQVVGKSPYLAGPRALGADPLVALIAPRWLDTPSVYGPLTSLLSRATAEIGAAFGSPVWGAGLAFKLAILGLGLAAIVLADRITDGHPRGHEAFVGFAFAPLFAWELSAQAHNDALLVVALVVFVFAARSERPMMAVLALTLGALAKMATLPLLALYLTYELRRSKPRAFVLGATVLLTSALFVLPYWHGLSSSTGPAAAFGGDAKRHAHSLADLLALALDPLSERASTFAYLVCWAGSTLLCLMLFARALRRATSVDHIVHDTLVLFLAYCLTTPWFQPWYATWLLPLALVERSDRLRRVVFTYAVLTVVQWAVPLDPVTTVAANAWVVVAWLRRPHTDTVAAPGLDAEVTALEQRAA